MVEIRGRGTCDKREETERTVPFIAQVSNWQK
jgi:hypothetical protein